jgi:ATP-dependent helicase HrpB
MTGTKLPISAFLPQIADALKTRRKLILSSAPGSGKTSLVPSELLKLTDRTVLLVEPRRIAARAAAARIAGLRGETVGGTVGYRVRGDRAESPDTRLLAVTPGVMLNLLQADPLLEGFGAVIFDEFHERQWEVDLALAFLDDLERSLGKSPYLVVMSATTDTAALKEYLPGAALLEVPGRLYDVDIRWSENTPDRRSVAAETARTVLRARRETPGDLLVFLPGVKEIAAVHEMLRETVDSEKEVVMPLHGSLPLAEQTPVLAPEPRGRRKIILATNVAESSITVDGVTGVVDSGLERRMEYEPGAGMSFLKLERITRASAEQRSGRAGRTAPGIAWRLWSKFDHAGRTPFRTPEIARSELARLVLETLSWGTTPDKLRWLDAPPEAALAEAGALLRRLEAVDEKGGLTPFGRRLAKLPVHPRLGAMLLRAEEWDATELAIDLAARLEERTSPERSAEITEVRLSRDAAVLKKELRALCRRKGADPGAPGVSPGVLLAAAFPEWIAARRGRSGEIYHLANGSDARLRPGDDLERCGFLAVARLGGSGGDAQTIALAAPLDRAELELHFADHIRTSTRIVFNPDTGRVTAKEERKLGGIVLSEGTCAARPAEIAQAVVDAALERELEIPPRADSAARRFLDRVRFARRLDPEHYPEWEDGNWRRWWSERAAASPIRSFAELEKLPWLDMMRAELGNDTLRRLDREYPPVFKPPRGSEIRIDYSQELPTLPVRIQSLYTLDVHPCVGTKKLPLKLELLSPANRPVQLTSDLPGFWRGSWSLVRKEMKSRYPKHLWPEDPLHL